MSLDRTKLCHKLKVAKRIQETADTVSLALEVPSALQEKFKYRAGQFITFFLDVKRAGKDEEIHRSYSLASSPDYDQDFKIAVKAVEGGLGSNFLAKKIKEGDEVWVTPPAGLFCLPAHVEAKKIAFFAAGSGITPIISLIKTTLKTTKIDCALFYQNREEKTIIFYDELRRLALEFGPRFSVSFILSEPAKSWSGLKGMTAKSDVKEFFARTATGPQSLHFICGPQGYMQAVSDALKDLGVDKKNIMIESFAASTPKADSKTSSTSEKSSANNVPALGGDEIWIGEKNLRSTPEMIEAVIDGKTHEIAAREGATILETLLEAGLNPPYSCMDGACMACMAKLDSGLAYQKELGILAEENVEAGECLTCQARPASAKVRITYG